MEEKVDFDDEVCETFSNVLFNTCTVFEPRVDIMVQGYYQEIGAKVDLEEEEFVEFRDRLIEILKDYLRIRSDDFVEAQSSAILDELLYNYPVDRVDAFVSSLEGESAR